MDAPKIIKALGGSTKVAKLMKLGQNGPQQVNNWFSRGFPAHIQLKHRSILRRGERLAEKESGNQVVADPCNADLGQAARKVG